MMQQFIDRDQELDFLRKRLDSQRAELILIYGRRRVGKTMLLLKLMESARGVYYLADKRPEAQSMEGLRSSMADFLGDDLFRRARFGSWDELLGAFAERAGDQRLVLIIDEFPFLVESNRALPSILGKVWDTVLSKGKMLVVLCGSSIGMMEEMMGYGSPLYGRRTAQWQVMPMDVVHLRSFFPQYDPNDLMRTFGTLDMVPFYLNQFDPRVDYFANVQERVLDKGSLLYLEPEFLLRQELREPASYMAILRSISLGNTRFNQIIDDSGLEKSLVSKYLSVLEALHIVERVYPVTERQRKRRALYRLRDNYFGFWFRYVYPNKSLLEQGRKEAVLDLVRKDLDSYLGRVFERASAEMLWRHDNMGLLPFRLRELGPWWTGEEEIDLVGHDGSANILFAECKWGDLRLEEAIDIIEKLVQKRELMPWKKGKRNEQFCLIARSIEGEQEIAERGHLAFDLKDFWPPSPRASAPKKGPQ